MKRDKFLDSQVIRTGFYSCSEDGREAASLSETDSRHQTGFLGRGLCGELSRPVRKKIRIIREAVKKTGRAQTRAKKKNQQRNLR